MSFLKLDKITLEAIDYQGRYSSFAKELVIFFQEFIDLRDNAKGTIKEIKELVRKEFSEPKNIIRLNGILKKYTNIDYTFKLHTGSISAGFATLINVDNLIDKAASRRTYKTNPTDIETYSKRIEQFKDGFNRKEGKLNPKDTTLLFKNSTTMYFCVDTAFFCEFYHEKAVNLTAEEITAIILHECGHTITLADNIGTVYNNLSDLTEPVVVNVKSMKEAKAAIQKTKAIIKNTSSNNDSKTVRKTTDFFDRVLTTMEKSIDDDKVIRVGFIFYAVVAFVLFMCIRICMCCTIGAILSKFKWEIVYANTGSLIETSAHKGSKTKDGDFKRTIVDMTDMEYDSDEFVTKHGLGLSLISGLDKLYTNTALCSPIHFGSKPAKSLMYFNLIMALQTVTQTVVGMLPSPYGAFNQRNASVGDSILADLRATNLPKALEDDLVREYEKYKQLNELLDKRINSSYGVYTKFINFLQKILTVNDLLKFMINGKADEDYIVIMDAAKHMRNNELVYYAKRIDQMV